MSFLKKGFLLIFACGTFALFGCSQSMDGKYGSNEYSIEFYPGKTATIESSGAKMAATYERHGDTVTVQGPNSLEAYHIQGDSLIDAQESPTIVLKRQ